MMNTIFLLSLLGRLISLFLLVATFNPRLLKKYLQGGED
jgi:hypothetical protein